ncbi:hypothetical protein BE11_26585 [Sorangium cellulosum]|nr:hypothetical protein BE11_26585 [Sorangium cellulosum]
MISRIRSALARCSIPALPPLAALALAVATTGCDKVGCFEWTEIEGACPSQAEALAYFGSDECNGQVESVDSEPEYDGDYCCYSITKRDDYGACTSFDGRSSPPSPPPQPAPAPQPAPSPPN